MIAKLSGKTAPPTPCSARHAISVQMLPANDAPTQPTKNTERLISSTRSLPYWSPSLPSSGVQTAEVSRNAVKSQAAQAVVVCRSCWKIGSAGITIVCCTA